MDIPKAKDTLVFYMFDQTQPTFVSILLERMINVLKGVCAEHSIVHVSDQLGNGLAQRHGLIGEGVPGRGRMLSEGQGHSPVEIPTVLGNDPQDRVLADTGVKQLEERIQPSFSSPNHHIPETFLETTHQMETKNGPNHRSSEH